MGGSLEGAGHARVGVLAGGDAADLVPRVTEGSDHPGELDDLRAGPDRDRDPHAENTSSKYRRMDAPGLAIRRSGRMGSPRIARRYSPTRSAPA